MYGEYDLHAISAEAVEHIADLVNTYHPGKGKYVVIPRTEHSFARLPSMAEYVRLRDSGAFTGSYMNEHYNPAVAESFIAWMREVMSAS